ncbi:lamin tail domain-containing protein [Candidatus Woesearchaeota archaeon]|nr:lamin tail domain-containing protein [Candidatus Woesearchaeota archaeon]
MAQNPEYQFKKLNDLLSNSFTNVKTDVRDLNGRFDALSANFASFTTESVRTAFNEQQKIIIEQQKALNQLSERITDLERQEPKVVEKIISAAPMPLPEHSFKTKDSALAEVRKLLREEGRKPAKEEKSVYDIPEGQVRITKTMFKPMGKKGKKKPTDEWVEVTGYGVDISGWKLWDKGKKHTFTFPEGFVIYGPVKVITGKGRNTNTKLFWKKPRPVWNDTGDVATLANKRGRVVSQVMSEPTYSFQVLK